MSRYVVRGYIGEWYVHDTKTNSRTELMTREMADKRCAQMNRKDRQEKREKERWRT